jgi:DNA-binding IscR family transcriptional regulator
MVAQRINITPEILKPIIDQLLEHKLLVTTNGSKPGLLPAHPPETQKVLEILYAIRKAEERGSGSMELLPRNEAVEALYAKLNSALEEGFGGVTLKDISGDEAISSGANSPVITQSRATGKADGA